MKHGLLLKPCDLWLILLLLQAALVSSLCLPLSPRHLPHAAHDPFQDLDGEEDGRTKEASEQVVFHQYSFTHFRQIDISSRCCCRCQILLKLAEMRLE